MTPRIIVLNGVGSAGKSSIARALQAIAAVPLLHVEMDAFLAMLPARLEDDPESFAYRTIFEDGLPSVAIAAGPAGERLMRGMRSAVAALAGAGNDLIVDEVMTAADKVEYERLLAGFAVRFVGVHAPLEVLERRERARGDRMIGLARWQYPRIHRDIVYDLKLDTGTASALECAQRIKARFAL